MPELFDVAEILRNAATRYAKCSSYSDFGTVRQSDNKNSIKHFRTHFVRPNKFRFEWIGYHPYFGKDGGEQFYALWCDGKRVFESYDFNDNQVEEAESLQQAVDDATGISSRSATTIYCLLISEECSSELEFLDISDWHLRSLKAFEDEPNYALRGSSCQNNGEDTDIWIKGSDFSLQKIRQRKIITVADVETHLAFLAEQNPELFEMAKVIERPQREERYVTETEYISAEFDIAISPDVFTSGIRTLYL